MHGNSSILSPLNIAKFSAGLKSMAAMPFLRTPIARTYCSPRTPQYCVSRVSKFIVYASQSGKGFGGGSKPAKSPAAKSTKLKTRRGPEVDDPHMARLLQKLDREEAEKSKQRIEKSNGSVIADAGQPSSLADSSLNSKLEASPSELAASLPTGNLGVKNPKDGWVDYVQVASWDKDGLAGASMSPDAAEMDDLGSLRVKSFVPGQPGIRQQQTGAPAQLTERNTNKTDGRVSQMTPSTGSSAPQPPLYERLVHHLAVLESRGELAVAQPKSKPSAKAKSLPPFHRWQFNAHHFLQYLVDQHAVFSALDEALARAAQCIGEGLEGEGLVPLGEAAKKLLLLSRSGALEKDMEALAEVLKEEPKGTQRWDDVSTEAMAYAKVLQQCASRCIQADREAGLYKAVEGDAAAVGQLNLLGRKETGEGSAVPSHVTVRLCILAHAFALHVAHITTGMRVGARAVELEPSVQSAGAISYCRDYVSEVSDPLKWLMDAMNTLGQGLVENEVEVLMEELPKAMIRTSLQLKILAVEGNNK